jgi:hypothetical protein
MVYAYLQCYGANGVAGGGDDSYLLLGTYTLTVNPPVQTTLANVTTSACSVTITRACAGETFGAISNLTGGASAANWDAATGTYTSNEGDIAGTFNVVVTGVGGSCTTTLTISTPACSCSATYPVCAGNTLPLLTTPPTGAATADNVAVGTVNTTAPYQVDFVLICNSAALPAGIIPNAAVGTPDATNGTASATLAHIFTSSDNCVLYAVNYDSSTGTPVYTGGASNSLVQTNQSVVCIEKVAACIQVNPLPVVTIADQTVCASVTSVNLTVLEPVGQTGGVWSNAVGTISPATAVNPTTGPFTYTYTNGNGCVGSDAVAYTINNCTTPCAANVSDLPDQEICQGYSGTLAFPLEVYNAIYGAAPPADGSYDLVYVLTDNSDNILQFSATPITDYSLALGAPNASNTPGFVYNSLAPGIYRMYEIIYRETDGPLTYLAAGNNMSDVDLTVGTCLDATYGNIYVNPAPNAVAGNTGPICPGSTVTLTASGGSNYSWETGQNSFLITASPAITTTYTVTVSDSNTPSCSATATTEVVVSPSYTAVIGGGGTNTCDATAEAVTVTINDTNGPWTVLYQDANGNAFTKIVTDVAAAPATADLTSALGIYTLVSVTSTAPGGCSATVSGSATIDNNLVPPTATAAPTAVLCNGDATGAVTLTVNGASGTQTYLWSNGITTQNLTGVVAGTYTVTVTDGTCTVTTSATITQPATALSASASSTATTCNLANGTITASANGGTAGYTYSIDGTNFVASNVFIDLVSGNYTVTVKDAKDCTATTPIVVGASAACGSIGDLVWLDTNGDGIYDPLTESGIPNVTVTLTYPNGTTVSIETDANGNYLFTNLPAGNYTVTVDQTTAPAGTSLSTLGSYTHNLLA